MSTAELLAVYDAQLRMEAEVADATEWHRHGPLVRARWGDSGFVSGRDLSGLTAGELEALVTDTLAWFRDETSVTEVEWKTRGHDRADLLVLMPPAYDASYPGLVSLEPGKLIMSYYSDVAYASGQVPLKHFPEFRYKQSECDIYIAEIEVGEL